MSDSAVDNILKQHGITRTPGGAEPEPAAQPASPEPAPAAEPEPAANPAAAAEPAVDPAASTDPQGGEDPPPAPAFDFKAAFGDRYESADSVKEVLSNYEKLNAEYKVLKNTNPYASDEVEAINKFVSNGGDLQKYYQLSGLDVEKMSDAAVIAAKLQIEQGLSRDDADWSVKDRYKVDPEAEEDDPSRRDVERRMSIEAKLARQWLADHKSKSLDLPDRNALLQQRITNLEPMILDLAGKIDSPTLELENAEKYQYSENAVRQAVEQVKGMLGSPQFADLQDNPEGRRTLSNYMKLFAQMNDFQSIVNFAVSEANRVRDLAEAKAKANPGEGLTGQPTPATPAKTGKDTVESQVEWIAKNFGVRI